MVATLVGLPILLGLLLPETALAADPPSGTLDPAVRLLEWDGPAAPVAINPSPLINAQLAGVMGDGRPTCSGQPVVLECDEFDLTVNMTDQQYTATGGVSIVITWGTTNSDFDLYVIDENDEVVATSGQFTTTQEQVFIPRAIGSYTVLVAFFDVVNDQYHGVAELQGVKVIKKKPKPKKKK
jgi:hypothetical protein